MKTKRHTQTSRAGSTIERINNMMNAGIHQEVIALQLSSDKIKYTKRDINTLTKIWESNKSTVAITKKVEDTLIKDQKENGAVRSKLKKVS